MASTNSSPSPKTQKSKMNPYYASAAPPPLPQRGFKFDTSLFSMDGTGSPSLSQPYQPTIPVVNNNTTSHSNKRPASPSSLHPSDRDRDRTQTQPHTPGVVVVPGASPQSSTTNNSYYHNHNMSFPRGPGSYYSPNPSFFDPSPSSHNPGDESPAIMDGFAEHTTPNFEDVEMPPLADDDVYEVDDGVSATAYSTPGGGGGGGEGRGGGLRTYPSPRATISPSPGGGGNEDVQIKVEQFTPTHSTTGNGPGINMHPTPISHSSSSISLNRATAGGAVVDLTVKRGEDGAWSGGYDPNMRAALGLSQEAELPFSLKEQTINQLRELKNAEIEDWLKRNTITGDGAGGKDVKSCMKPGGLTVKAPKRGRAKSFSDFRIKGSVKNTEDAMIVKPGESSAGNTTAVLVIDDDDMREGEYDYEEDSSVASSFIEGSLDNYNDDESMNTSEAPPTEEDLKRSEQEAEEERRRQLEHDPSLLPNPRQFYSAHPWNDTVGPITRGAGIAMKSQPNTANAAMRQFQQYADNIETASRVATFGSEMSKNRRLSASDIDRIATDGGLLKRLSFGKDKDKEGSGHQRRPSLFSSIVNRGLKRGFSNAGDKLKESKEGEKEKEKERESLDGGIGAPSRKRGDSVPSSIISGTTFGPLKQRTSWTKPGGLKVDTNVRGAFAQMAGIGAGVGQSSAHTASTGKPSSPTPPEKRGTGLSMGNNVIQAVRRARSKSELATGSRLQKSSKPTFGIVSILGQYGGPPALPIKSPVASNSSPVAGTLKPRFTFGDETRKRGIAAANQQLLSPPGAHKHDGFDGSDDEMEDQDVPRATSQAPLPRPKQQKLVITPNTEGFTAHTKSKAPGLNNKLVDRIVYEQGKRFKKLVDHRQKHLAAIKNGGKCSNSAKCRGNVGSIGAGGQEEDHGHKRNLSTGSYEGEGEPIYPLQSRSRPGAHLGIAYSSDETVGDHSPIEGKVAATQFPSGVPQPPVSRLPAEFECPICFKVKKFTKPSDWTKHVHEDVHPFTCTFVECTEPKSFKRKADWVRHENERHRHLEWWTCNIPDCTHTCYRKDNFVQHLVREHKMAEPKLKAQKATKAAGKGAGKKGKGKAAVGGDGAPTKEDFDKVWQIVDDCHKLTSKLPTEEKCRFCGAICGTWKKLTVHLARHMEAISLPVLDLITDDAVVLPSTRNSGKQASANTNASSNTAPVAPMPKVQPATPMQLPIDMDIDPVGGTSQRQQSADGEYEEEVQLPQYGSGNTNYGTHHMQQTPPRSSPHIPLDHSFNGPTPPHGSQYPARVMTPVGFSPEQNIHGIQNVSGLHPMHNQPFDYTSAGHEMYPSPSSITGPRASSVNSGYSPSPTYSQRPLPHSPAQRMISGMPLQQQHLQVQQQQQQQQQPSYFSYGHASGQLPGNVGLGVSQVHSQTVATAHSLIENHGQYGYYPPPEIPMELMGVAMAPIDPNNQFGFIP